MRIKEANQVEFIDITIEFPRRIPINIDADDMREEIFTTVLKEWKKDYEELVRLRKEVSNGN